MTDKFLSTPSARRATFCGGSGGSGWPISIHALREEGDAYEPFHLREKIEISIHALREEGDREQAAKLIRDALFLSTPSARRAIAPVIFVNVLDPKFLSTPSARRATLPSCLFPIDQQFLSTPSARRAT